MIDATEAPKRSFKFSDLRFGEGEGPAMVEGRAIFAVQPDINVQLAKLVLVSPSKALRAVKIEIGDETFELDRASHSSEGRYVEVDLSSVTTVLTPVQHAFVTVENDGPPASVRPVLEGSGSADDGAEFKAAVTLALRPKVGRYQCRTRIPARSGLVGPATSITFTSPFGLFVETARLFIEKGADDLILVSGKLGNIEVLSEAPASYLLEHRQFGRFAVTTANRIEFLVRNTCDEDRYVDDIELCGSAIPRPVPAVARRRRP